MPANTPTTAEKVAFLRRPEVYAEETGAVDVKETHMSWVFLTERFAFKMKKPVKLSYLDFSTLAARRYFCDESLRLNRRLAPAVYLDVLPLTLRPGGDLELAGDGAAVEYLEKMHRLPEHRMLDRVIETGDDVAGEALPAARLLGRFYRERPAEPLHPLEHRQRLARDVRDNAAALMEPRFGLDRPLVRGLASALERTLEQHAELFADRLAGGHVVEGHGDLRPEHVCLADPPVVIDCLEFNRALRILDAVDEIAYLALECERLGSPLDNVLFPAYTNATGDAPPERLVAFYKVHRALLRAKLAVWHLLDHVPAEHRKWVGRAEDYLRLAARHARRL